MKLLHKKQKDSPRRSQRNTKDIKVFDFILLFVYLCVLSGKGFLVAGYPPVVQLVRVRS